ncbi:hypothetical protein L914_16704 [Phytophthora nicotianae]|uniref:Uncharacterized protein n=1 Tax=Phytophthora nicotianae TaxID=4792 RepID=W2MJW7_PHYNI|nr:hypothetical protein L914_16704 [Phytophthora nicotianae]
MVLENDDRKVWTSLVSMGRWHCYAEGTGDHIRRAVYLAASKLLGGLHPTQQTSYEDTDSMQGVASMLCRLGLRPRASSAFASQAIANFMAVLHHINYKLDAHICSYVTKPVLAFGVTHVWYEIKQQVLGKYILPKFWELLTQGVIETGDIGVVVARSFLLLAMDATIAHGLPVDAYSLANGTHHFIGQFCSVKRFLRVFDGSYKRHVEAMADNDQKSEGNGSVESKLLNVEVEPNDEKKTPAAPKLVTMDNATPEQRANFESWIDGWDQWRRCFSHFFELTAMQATATLWFLLGRRAAGAFPRDQDEADFMIPIFCKSTAEVSFVIVKATETTGNLSSLLSKDSLLDACSKRMEKRMANTS